MIFDNACFATRFRTIFPDDWYTNAFWCYVSYADGSCGVWFHEKFCKKTKFIRKTGNLIKSAGRNTLVGAGLLAGMDLENQERQSQELLRNEIAKDDAVEVTMSDSPEQVTSEPMTAGEDR